MVMEEVIKGMTNAGTETGLKAGQGAEGVIQDAISKNLLPEVGEAHMPMVENEVTKKIEDYLPKDFGIDPSDEYTTRRPWDERWHHFRQFEEREKLRPDELNELEKKYNNEVAKLSAGGQVNETRVADWEKISPEELAEKRSEYQRQKADLLKKWEEKNGQTWPRYEEDIYSESGKLIARKGDAYDAHHIQPLEFGGANSSENLTPMHKKDHHDRQGVHRPSGPYDEIAKDQRMI